MQTILGSGGPIGIELAKSLKKYTDEIRLVSRNPQKVNNSDLLFATDLQNPENIDKAIKGSTVVYITIGFPYSYKIWKKYWPPFMKNVIESCEKYDSKLVFFDNVYMYNKSYIPYMTEETPISPPSKKGEIRMQIAKMIEQEVEKGKLSALIARSADYYGPNTQNTGFLNEAVFTPLHKGEKASWLGSTKYKHSFTYTPDAGRATALLGNTDDAYDQVWHLPTASDPLTGMEWINNIAKELQVNPKYQVAPKFLVKLIGLFNPLMRELAEMVYQYDRDYIFISDKFNKHFDFVPTSYSEGIKQIVEAEFK